MLFVTLGYIWSCAVYPYKACRSCRGFGHFRSSILGAIRLCRRCNGTGRTLRAGRRAYNATVRAHRAIRKAQNRDQRDGQ
ncbi:hypothetical protein FPZ12_006935 [Amycolatopsis acidicola]|uniref:Uncharacterized protein n=2 Tax=Amycolatopsis acidicola TaxID=2596893 RepID=A0A5N0VHY0_9PSEU|nr:hypothetical protein FPZ12_006935 [Amycolatopsis acidicola]